MWQEKKRQPPRRKPVRFEVVPAKGRWLDDADVLSLESGCRLFWELRQGERRVNNKERNDLVCKGRKKSTKWH